MWTASTCTAFLIASSTGCSGVTAKACGAVSPTPGRSGAEIFRGRTGADAISVWKKKKKRCVHDNSFLYRRTNKCCIPITSTTFSPSNSFILHCSPYTMPFAKALVNVSISVTERTVFSLLFSITRNTVAAE